MTRRFVVGLDGSPGSMAALRWATELAGEMDGDIIAVHVLTGRPLTANPAASPGTGQPPDWQIAKLELEREWTALCRERGVPYETRLVYGNPVTQLINIALQAGATMIVVGSRGLDGFSELLLGSVSHQLAQHSPLPVLVVRHPPEATRAQRELVANATPLAPRGWET